MEGQGAFAHDPKDPFDNKGKREQFEASRQEFEREWKAKARAEPPTKHLTGGFGTSGDFGMGATPNQGFEHPGEFAAQLQNEFDTKMKAEFYGHHERFRQSDWELDE